MSYVKDSVAVLMPCAGPVDPTVVQHMMTLVSQSNANGYIVRQVGVTERTLIHTARNFLAEGFLQTDCEWALWVDADMILEARTVPVLMQWAKKLNAQFLTGIYYQRLGSHNPVVMVKVKDRKYKNEYEHSAIALPEQHKVPVRVDVCGFGCVLMHRDVITKLQKPWFKYIHEGDVECSEDFYFCTQAKKAGIELWAVPELSCGHVGSAPIITRKDFKYEKDKFELVELNKIGG